MDNIVVFDSRIAKRIGIEKSIIMYAMYGWIKKNALEDKNFQDGMYWTYNTVKAMSREERFSYMSVSMLTRHLKEMVNDGFLVKGNYNKMPFDRTSWYAFGHNSIELFKELNIDYSFLVNGICEEDNSYIQEEKLHFSKITNAVVDNNNSHLSETTNLICQKQQTNTNNITNNITNNKENNKEIIQTSLFDSLDDDIQIEEKNDVEEFIDKIYDMYPTKCPMRNVSLGKCKKNKTQIKALLKIYTKEQIEFVVKHELSEKMGKQYLKNFGTFLNQFPDPVELEKEKEKEKETRNIDIKKQEYDEWE